MQSSTHKKRTRKTYDSDIKIAAQFDILPEELARRIPKSTLSTFRNSDHSHILRLEFPHDLKERLDLIKRITKLDNIVKILRSYILVKDTIISIYSKIKVIKPYLKYYKEKIVATINRVKGTFTLERTCKYFKISKSRFFSWMHQVNHSCPASVLKMCRQRWPNQITQKEETTIIKLSNDPFYKGWAVYQIAVHALLNNKLFVSIGTWYKYIKVLGINRNNIKKKIPKTGIRASKPNEIWHMDVTLYKTVNNITARIYILIDNASRFILNWKVFPYLSGEVSLDMVRESYHKYLTPAAKNSTETMLLVDGGSENNNSNMDNFLNQELIPIKKLIAQKDIKFSNSMVEAFNKTLKYRHLFPHKISDYESLVNHLQKCIPEYNNIRPHCAHKYLTPAQAYFSKGIDIERIRILLKKAREKRITENKKVVCPVHLT